MEPEEHVVTADGLVALEAELAQLEGGGRREIAERIKTAREWGDLKENAEYHAAKEEQAHLETRIARLRERISRAVVLESGPSDVVGLGSTVAVRDQDGKQHTWQVVSSHEADPAQQRVSAQSPVGRALLGRRAGDTAEVALPRGRREFVIESVQ